MVAGDGRRKTGVAHWEVVPFSRGSEGPLLDFGKQTPFLEGVDDFVAAEAPGLNKYLQTSTRPPQAIGL